MYVDHLEGITLEKTEQVSRRREENGRISVYRNASPYYAPQYEKNAEKRAKTYATKYFFLHKTRG